MRENVECKRCGYRWYAQQYEEKDILPHYCTKCYRKDVGPIPKEPNFVVKALISLRDRITKIPGVLAGWRKSIKLWMENNRYLIDMGLFGLALLIILMVFYFFIFVWG